MGRKKIILIITLLIFLSGILMINLWKKHKLYEKYRYPNENFFGKELYTEIIYNCSDQELEVGNAILDNAMKVATYTGNKKNTGEMSDVGALSRYYYYNWKVPAEYETVFQEMEFQLITCKITEDRGNVWVVYTRRMKSEDKKLIAGSWDILSLWEIEKQDGDWKVVKISEAP